MLQRAVSSNSIDLSIHQLRGSALLANLYTFVFGLLEEQLAESLGHRAHCSIADGSSIDLPNPSEFAHSACGEALIRVVHMRKRDIPFDARDVVFFASNIKARWRVARYPDPIAS